MRYRNADDTDVIVHVNNDDDGDDGDDGDAVGDVDDVLCIRFRPVFISLPCAMWL